MNNRQLIKIIFLKDLRSGKIFDYFLILFIFQITLYSKISFFFFLILFLIPDFFTSPLWHVEKERLFFCYIASKQIILYSFFRKAIFLFECNIIFLICQIFINDQKFLINLFEFNSYLLLFFSLSDVLFLIIRPKNAFERLLLIFIIFFLSTLISLLIHFSEPYISKTILSKILLFITVLMFLFSHHFFTKNFDPKKFIYD